MTRLPLLNSLRTFEVGAPVEFQSCCRRIACDPIGRHPSDALGITVDGGGWVDVAKHSLCNGHLRASDRRSRDAVPLDCADGVGGAENCRRSAHYFPAHHSAGYCAKIRQNPGKNGLFGDRHRHFLSADRSGRIVSARHTGRADDRRMRRSAVRGFAAEAAYRQLNTAGRAPGTPRVRASRLQKLIQANSCKLLRISNSYQ